MKEARPADGKQEEWPDISHDLETRRAMKKASAKPDPAIHLTGGLARKAAIFSPEVGESSSSMLV